MRFIRLMRTTLAENMDYLRLAKSLVKKNAFVPYLKLTECEKYYADDSIVEKYQTALAQKAQKAQRVEIIDLFHGVDPGREEFAERIVAYIEGLVKEEQHE